MKLNRQISGMITENSKIPFGNTHKGRKLKDCPNTYLQWMVLKLWDTDLHEFAYAAKKLLSKREIEDQNSYGDLEEAADEFLKRHGVNPATYADRTKRRR